MTKQEAIDGMLRIAKLCDENEDSNSACLARQIATRLGDLPERAFNYKPMAAPDAAPEAAPAPEATPASEPVPEPAPIQEVSAEVQDTERESNVSAEDSQGAEQPVDGASA